jgi:hypothetical protein
MGGCVIHFGMHKTGSSSIQHSLARARDLGPDHYFVSLGSRKGNLSRALMTAFGDEPWLTDLNLKWGRGKEELLRERPEIRACLAEELGAAAEGRTAILSAEVLSTFSEPEVARLAGALERAAGSVSAVGYVRAPAERMASGFQQQLKAGYDRFDPAVSYPPDPGYRRLKAFDNVLGRERVSLWKFDPGRFPDGDVVRDFCDRLGIAIAADDLVRVNEGLSRPAMSILFAYRLYGPGYGVGSQAVRENHALIEALREVSGAKFEFDESVVAPVLEAKREDLAWIEERLGEELRSGSPTSEGVSSQDELLAIEPAAVSAFVDALRRRFDLELPNSATDRIDTDPRAVALTVETCRTSIRELLFGVTDLNEGGGSQRPQPADAAETLAVRPARSFGRWRQPAAEVIVLAPTVRQPAVVGFEASGESEAAELVFTARVQTSDAPPLVLRLSIAEDGTNGRVLDEIKVAGRADRDWSVPIPAGTGGRDLRMSCRLTARGSQGRRARVRVTRPALGPAAR